MKHSPWGFIVGLILGVVIDLSMAALAKSGPGSIRILAIAMLVAGIILFISAFFDVPWR